MAENKSIFSRFINWINNLFGIIEDWKIVDVIHANWCISYDFGNYDEKARYEIHYSKTANEFKLKTYGYRAKDHFAYKSAIKLLQQYEKRLHDDNKTVNK